MKVLSRFEDAVVVISFVLIVLVTFVNVLTRYVFHLSLAFTEEITINFLVVLTMFGAVVGIRQGAHLGFTYIVENAKPAVQRVLVILGAALIIAFLAVLLIWGAELVIHQAERGRTTPSLDIPQWLFTASIPVAGLLGIVRTFEVTRTSLRERTSLESIDSLVAVETSVSIDPMSSTNDERMDGDAR